MLYDKRWEKPDIKANPVSLENFIAWLQTKPADEWYDYHAFGRCALGQWCSSMDHTAVDSSLEGDSYTYRINGTIVNLRDGFRSIVAYEPWTFGAALLRARTALNFAEILNLREAPMSAFSYLFASLAVISGNYAYQFMCHVPDWAVATERSFFQGWALLIVGIISGIVSIKP